MCQSCPACWRVEIADANTGRVIDVLHPISFNTSTTLTDVGAASFVVATKDVNPRRLTPHATLIYVINTCLCADRTVFGGVVEKIEMGVVTTTVGAYSMEGYLQRRNLYMNPPGGAGDPFTYNNRRQTVIAADLVNTVTSLCGIPLTGVNGGGEVRRTLTVNPWDHNGVYELVSGLAGMENGVEWDMVYTRSDTGFWSNEIVFRDIVGVDRTATLIRGRDLADFTLDIDAALHATRVRGVGAGSEATQLEAFAEADNGFPCFDAVPAWKDEETQATLQARVDGYLTDFDQPLVAPTVTFVDPYQPCPLNLGDLVTVDLCLGSSRYFAASRVVSIGWDQGVDRLSRSVGLLPVGDAGVSSVITDVNADCGCGVCGG